MNDTIVAIATAHGVGSICIVRLSGENALGLAFKLTKLQTLKPRFATLAKIYSNDEFIDEGIVIYFKSPASFTGEDVVEFQTHGGFAVANLILSELIRLGARLAKPGEFSKRAFLNGKMDLSKAESIQNLINARSESAAKIIARAMKGDLGKFVDEIRDELVKTLAFVETSIDYADDDLPLNLMTEIKNMLATNHEKLDRIVGMSRSRKGLIEGFKVAIIGKPNVGKSSILNALLNYERAIISDEAGTTRDRIEESINIGTHLVRIIDTAGIRKDAGRIEQIGITHSLKAIEEADIILAVFDSSNIADEQDFEIINLLKDLQKKIFYILNKCDLELKFNSLDLAHVLKISAKNGASEIIKALEIYLDSQDVNEILLNSTRQIECCKNASFAIKRALNLLNESELELFAYEINSAIFNISSITRPFERAEILDQMFSNFCLGK
ncbi:tRNA uridine-5-carboxymethylaminomethyl(34) synthesis GTPase MnmE [Campylobacter sp. RM16192]|uniref:tRNA uridine-5-carboxymethylaminomethyl(34) synthesis GTPase MnmE n=1 Tax=Campylobacter sp. RM16192 TaxID=1660080 RepID=UPI001451E3AA|nr:tRNA uridine-5-carboxymethylaminomethyl(34) synthesis GTPase MnmE [Campylobacter sp. RM16192]QCD52381.1 5-carboxymethylaminomethyluridine-tRNA synthase MnmEG, GTPase component [Campylobacter sp. RM16192]